MLGQKMVWILVIIFTFMHLPLVSFGCRSDTDDVANGVSSKFLNLIKKHCVTESTYLNNKQKTFAMLDTLLEQKADINLPSGDGKMPLEYAIKYEQRDLATYLVRHKATLGVVYHGSIETALLLAIKHHKPWLVKFLVRVGASGACARISMPVWYETCYCTDSCSENCCADYNDIRFLLFSHGIFANGWASPDYNTKDASPDILDRYNNNKINPELSLIHRENIIKEIKLVIHVSDIINIIADLLPLEPLPWPEYVKSKKEQAAKKYEKFVAGELDVRGVLSDEVYKKYIC